MIETDIDKRKETANAEDNERDAIVRGVFRGQSQFALGERNNLAMGGDQQYTVTFLIKDVRVIAKPDLVADIRRQLKDAGMLLREWPHGTIQTK